MNPTLNRCWRLPWRRLRHLGRVLQQREVWVRPEIALTMERHGTDYGGWTVWPEPLNEGAVVYSFGVEEDISFDLALIGRFGCRVHAFDPTPRSIAWVRRQQTPAAFVFHEYGLGATDGMLSFVPPANPAHVSYAAARPEASAPGLESFPVKRLRTIAAELGHSRIDLLKMDIEGAEYDALADLLDAGLAVDQILVEFHHRLRRSDVQRTRQTIRRLQAQGYGIFDVSPTGEEYAFVRHQALGSARTRTGTRNHDHAHGRDF